MYLVLGESGRVILCYLLADNGLKTAVFRQYKLFCFRRVQNR